MGFIEMTVGDILLRSYREFQQGWTRMTEHFGREAPAGRDDTARGEFISDFISERDLQFPVARHGRKQG